MKTNFTHPGPLVGSWKSRVVVGSKGEGMQKTGANPPFYPDENSGWSTTINPDGTGRVDFRNWKLHECAFADAGRVLFGKYTIDEGSQPAQQNGEFCIRFVTGTAGEPMFVGVVKLNTGVWQAWWGTK